jgi:hypothetical protein
MLLSLTVLLGLLHLGACEPGGLPPTVSVAAGYHTVLEFPGEVLDVQAPRGDVQVTRDGSRVLLRLDADAVPPLARAEGAAPWRRDVGMLTVRTAGPDEYRFRLRSTSERLAPSIIYVPDEGERVHLSEPLTVPVSADTMWIRFPAPIIRVDIGDTETLAYVAEGDRLRIHTVAGELQGRTSGVVILADDRTRTIPLIIVPGGAGGSYRWLEHPARLEAEDGLEVDPPAEARSPESEAGDAAVPVD